MSVTRYDIGQVEGVERLDNGFLRADGHITRVGVFTYRQQDGTQRRELRLPDEVFNKDSIHSFQLAPLTNDHPGEAITSRNARKYRAGLVSNVRADGSLVAARIQIEDEETIAAAENGKRELSCGYTCDVEEYPGVTDGIEGIPDGLRFDAVQRNIRGNHVALVTKGRAGPQAALRLDSDAIQIDETQRPRPQPQGAPTMALIKIKHDGIDVEITEAGAQVVSAMQAKLDTAAEATAAAVADLSGEKARADKAEEDLVTAQKLHTDSTSQETIDKRVAERVEIVTQGKATLGDDFKADATDDEIKRAVCLKLARDPKALELKLDANDAVYLAVRYDAAVDAIEPPKADDPAKKAHSILRGATGNVKHDAVDVDASRAAMVKRNAEAWAPSADA